MAYMKIIEETTNWTCPKTADYEIICVAGGQGGAGRTSSGEAVYGVIGGSTSFGNYITVTGAWGDTNKQKACGGMGGYTLFAYGGVGSAGGSNTTTSPSANGGANGGTGLGYGAGGGCANAVNSGGGGCGKLKTTFVTINKDTVVNCVIGKGGLGGVGTESTGLSGVDGVIVIREV